MKIIYDEDYLPEEPCLSCEKSYIEDIWGEYCCDEKQCIHQEEYARILRIKQCIQEMQSLRIDVDTECQYSDPTGVLRDKYELANEMLDDCIEIVRKAGI